MNLKENERIDDLQRKLPNGRDLKIIQNPDWFCFGIDAVLLSDFADIKRGDVVMDLGTGTGIIPLLLAAKTEAAHIDCLEIQTGEGVLSLVEVQLEGKKRMEVDAFLRGYAVEEGTQLN